MEMLFYKQIGTGLEKVIVMHNWMGDSTSYNFVIPYLNTDKYTYVFADLRGYGGSKELQGSYSVEEACLDILNVVDFLNWDSFHIIGHSMSGMIAQKIAAIAFNRVKSVVAIAPVPACGSQGPQEMITFLEHAATDNDEYATECINSLTGNRYTPMFAQSMVATLRKHSTKEARLGFLHMFLFTDFSSSVEGLKTPMLVLFGEHDFKESEALMRSTFLKWYPNAELQCCKSSGHYPMIETPVTLISEIENFFAKF